MAFRFNRMFELSALQDQRLQLPEWLTFQTGYEIVEGTSFQPCIFVRSLHDQ